MNLFLLNDLMIQNIKSLFSLFEEIFTNVVVQGEILCFGEPVRYGRPMFSGIEDERYPQPVIVPYCLTGDTDDVTFDNFGKEVQLYLHERRSD